jgi:hypothetical protein
MNLSSTKNLSTTKSWLISLGSIGLIGLIGFSKSAQAAKYGYRLNFDARYGTHTHGAPNVATHRHSLEYEQKAEYNKELSSVLGLRAEVEAAYASLPERYGVGDVGKYDSQTFLPRDNYLQYQSGSLRARLGYQQVVWGEAFGSYYADIVNPKDFREAGLGDLSRNRLALAMVNLQWIGATSSLQLLYIPQMKGHLLPKYGSDFNTFKLPAPNASLPLAIQRDPTSAPTRGEAGFRVTKQISSYDFSLFYLNYYDRAPVYQLQTTFSPLTFTAVPEFKGLQTAGMTMTADFSGYLLRAEILQHFNRELNTLASGALSSSKSNELIYVLGFDLPTENKWQAGLQYSESLLKNPERSTETWASRKTREALASLRLAKTFNNDIGLELLGTTMTSDSGSLVQASVNTPISSKAEFLLGIDKFDGDSTTALGSLKDASRAWVMFKAALN